MIVDDGTNGTLGWMLHVKCKIMDMHIYPCSELLTTWCLFMRNSAICIERWICVKFSKQDNLSSKTSVLRICFAQSLCLFVVFCISLFVLLSFLYFCEIYINIKTLELCSQMMHEFILDIRQSLAQTETETGNESESTISLLLHFIISCITHPN